ncbi:phosphodiesterase [Mesorhizobium sp. LHD-90]|uniref:phosphodiesterase n=1 Tax=Mesorhizobium sp. LHD-90 TaxID=3071414 RepID=UPI0027DF8660|nr:phosphodiesterase [Mesorhizobium sp. LHD-90]MDQ6434974.1 phosphodiesterase [Mesorhizobium sp. LHD-90]
MLKILQISDIHLIRPGEMLFGSDPLARLEACIADVNRNHADADLVVFSGDLANDGLPEAYAALKERLPALLPPYRLMLGNHDHRANFLAAFPEILADSGFVQASVDIKGTRLILLDTLETGMVEGRLGGGRLEWLDARLGEAEGRPALVFTHHPPVDIHMPALDNCRLMDSQPLLGVLQKHGNVRHIFAGHVHRPVCGSWHGIPFSALRGTNHQSAPVFAGKHRVNLEPPAYAIILVSDGSVVVHYHDFLYSD